MFTVSSAPTPPDAPVVSEVTDVSSARVTWTEPSFTGAFPIFQYGVRARRCLSDLDAPCTSWTGWGYVTNAGASARSHVITTYGDDKGTADTADDEDLNLAPETRYQVRVDARSRDDKGTTDTADDETVYSGWSEPTEFITTPAQTDYDTDDDGLIEVGTLAQLNAIRYDLDGDGVVTDNASTTSVNEADEYALGFPFPTDDQCDDPNTSATTETCTGYELTADLDFDTDGSGAADSGDTYWNGGAGWLPIGRFTAVFEGNGHTIANLFIDRSATDGVGLFGAVVGAVRNLGLADADVTGRDATGALAGTLVRSGAISASWSTGSVTGGDGVGGLVGESGFNAEIIASYAAVSVTGVYDSVSFAGGEQVGGLVGGVRGGSVTASYATGSVDGDYDVGGLVGYNFRGTITASYATGRVTGRVGVAEDVGGLVGRALQGTVTNSYFDAQTTERVFGVGSEDDASGPNADNNVVDSGETNNLPGNTTAELQGPTGYTGIYADWNLDLDGDSTDDDPWDFGADFNYPALKVDFNGDGTPTYAEFGVQRGVAPPAMLLAASGLDTSNEAILVVTWSAPTFGNPAAPTGYQYRYSSDAGATWNPDWPAAETDTNWLDADTRTFTIPAPLAHRYEIEARAVFAAPLPLSQATRTVGGGTDYDTDDDGLIEVGTLAQLNAIRGDLDGDGMATDDTLTTNVNEAEEYAAAFPTPAFGMGCPLADHDSDPGTDPQPVCTGYELTADLDFDENGDDSRNDTYNTGSGWDPIGSFARGYFDATFDGNGHTISNLFINRSTTDYVGLFGETIGTLRSVGLEDVDVTGQDYVGALAGWSNGTITHSWATGGVAGRDNIGGLIGEMGQFRGNITSSSYAGVSVSGADNVGGLVGHVANGNVMATYATGSVTGTEWVGGLAGYNNEGAITASYATGSVSGTENVGGLVGGWSDFFGATITNSYFDAQTTGRLFGIGQEDNGSGTDADNNVVDAGETNSLLGGATSYLQTPTGYTGIYADWNLDLDNADDDNLHSTGQDDPWDFGENDDYPILKNVGGIQRRTDYDTDDDGLIEVNSLAKLNAMGYDLNADGVADIVLRRNAMGDLETDETLTDAARVAYEAAFPNPVAGMGCPATGCNGYELTADLDFDEDGNGQITSIGDPTYWNGGAGWRPIGDRAFPDGTENPSRSYNAKFDGNGHTISNLFINRPSANYIGLFGYTTGGISNIGLEGVNVTGNEYVGGLVGSNFGPVEFSYSSGAVSATTRDVGGLTGHNQSNITASYTSGTVSGGSNAGGLTGHHNGFNITASYSTAAVTGTSSVGGLIGQSEFTTVVTASYATGSVSGTGDNIGGLIGLGHNTAVFTNSYWDTGTSGKAVGVGSDDADDSGAIDGTETPTAGVTGKTSAELRTPTGYTGIYANWNLNLDGVTGNDDPWDFGADYNYPTLPGAGGKQKGPGPVLGLSAAFNDAGNLVISWSAPTDAGDGTLGDRVGSTYGVRYSTDGGTAWTSRTLGSSHGTTLTIPPAERESYRIEVWAIGDGAHREGKRERIGLPGAPQNLHLTTSAGRIDVSWSAPADTGGSDISGYLLDWRGPEETDWTTLTPAAADTSRSFTGLTADGTYEFRMAATNADGTGPYTATLTGIASDTPDYDSDNDGLIDIRNLAQLNAVRYDLDGDGAVDDGSDPGTAGTDAANYAAAFLQAPTGMGCPATGCIGYELMVDLTFTAWNSANPYWDSGQGWEPIGCCGSEDWFTAVFEGNGNTIANLFIERSSSDRLGLFGRLGAMADDAQGATVRNLTLTGASVTGDDYIGILAGRAHGTAAANTVITNVSVSGSVTAGDDYAGGLVGHIDENTRVSGVAASGSVTAGDERAGGLVGRSAGAIAASYSSASVTGSGTGSAQTGGLVGESDTGSSITASYATGSVTGDDDVGGLVGANSGTVTASFSTGAVSGNTDAGGLLGYNWSGATITASYWDTESSGQSNSGGGTGKTGAELRSPTGYTGIYATWDDHDIDGDGNADSPWDFGQNYNYPKLSGRGGPVGTGAGGDYDRYPASERHRGEMGRSQRPRRRRSNGLPVPLQPRRWLNLGFRRLAERSRRHSQRRRDHNGHAPEHAAPDSRGGAGGERRGAQAGPGGAHRAAAERAADHGNPGIQRAAGHLLGRAAGRRRTGHHRLLGGVQGGRLERCEDRQCVHHGQDGDHHGPDQQHDLQCARGGDERHGRGDILHRRGWHAHDDDARAGRADRPDPDAGEPAPLGVVDGAQGPGQPAPHRLLGAVPGAGRHLVADLVPHRHGHVNQPSPG